MYNDNRYFHERYRINNPKISKYKKRKTNNLFEIDGIIYGDKVINIRN